MCGIAGFLDLERRSGTQELEALGARHGGEAPLIAARTTAACGRDAEAGIVLGHRGSRSSIFLRPARSRWSRAAAAASSPITARSTMPRARPELEARGPPLPRPFRHRGDGRGLAPNGASRATVERLIGMFAFALWDRRERTLTPGARPARHQAALLGPAETAAFLFGSELKALRALPGWQPTLDRDCARRLSAARLCAGAALDLSRHPQARARPCR